MRTHTSFVWTKILTESWILTRKCLKNFKFEQNFLSDVLSFFEYPKFSQIFLSDEKLASSKD